MVQIGNFHIGKAGSAKKPSLHAGEAFLMWEFLVSRYEAIEQSQLFQNFAHDTDFKLLLERGLTTILEQEVNEVEKMMNKFQVTLPNRPPKSVSIDATTGIFTDEFLFKMIFTCIQTFLDQHIRTIRSITTNDELRQMFIRFLIDELDTFDHLCKYGKAKGWLGVPPQLK